MPRARVKEERSGTRHFGGCLVAVAACALGSGCPRDGAVGRPRGALRVERLARFAGFDGLRADRTFGPIAHLFPPLDQPGSPCRATRDITIDRYPVGEGPSRALLVRYEGCCSTKCRRNPESGEWQCGKRLFYLACDKDILVEARGNRYAALAASSFPHFDPGGGKPVTRVFYMDLTGQGGPEVVRWEELRQYQHTEWLIQAFRASASGLRRVADIRFHHSGPWQPDLNFPDRNKNGTREIELAVQEFDPARRRVVVRRRVYKFDRLLGKYVIADTVTLRPPPAGPRRLPPR